MDAEGTCIVQVELANGATMFVEAVETKKSGGMASVALPAKLDFDNVLGTLGELGSAVVDKLKVAGPSVSTRKSCDGVVGVHGPAGGDTLARGA